MLLSSKVVGLVGPENDVAKDGEVGMGVRSFDRIGWFGFEGDLEETLAIVLDAMRGTR